MMSDPPVDVVLDALRGADEIAEIAADVGCAKMRCPRCHEAVELIGSASLRATRTRRWIILALHTGLRAGELFGLQRQDANLDAATLTVRQSLIRVTGDGLQASQPKTAASAATIPLTAGGVTALRAHRLRQLQQRFRAGSAWYETGYVFTTEIGTPVSASNFMRQHFYPIAARGHPDKTAGRRNAGPTTPRPPTRMRHAADLARR